MGVMIFIAPDRYAIFASAAELLAHVYIEKMIDRLGDHG